MIKAKYILFIVIVLALYWAVFYKGQRTLDTQNIQNSIVQTSLIKDKPKNKLKKKTNKEIEKFDNLSSKKVETNFEIDSDLTYLKAYRDYIYFGKCHFIFNQLEKKQDPVAHFIERVQNYSPRSWIIPVIAPIEITQNQLNVFEDFLAKCQSLLLTEKEPYEDARKRLLTTYQSLTPNTQEEIDLSDGLNLYDKYQSLNNDLQRVQRGKTILDKVSVKNIRLKIKYLTTERKMLYASSNITTDDDLRQRIDVLNKEINTLNYQLYKDNITDKDEIIFIQDKLSQAKTKLYDFLKQNTSPDLFLAYSKELFYPNYGISGEVFKAINVHDHIFRREIYTIGINLVACAMNYPCDENSLLVQEICIAYINPEKFACGKSLEDYYFNYLLGPNQLQDIENYLNYMLKNYAKK